MDFLPELEAAGDRPFAGANLTSQQRFTTLTITSCCISFITFIFTNPLLGAKALVLDRMAPLLTLLHHALVLKERNKAITELEGQTSGPPVPSSLTRLPLSSTIPMILLMSFASAIWLASSTVAASVLGVYLWVKPSWHSTHMRLLTEGMLSLLEVILLMFMVSYCLRERDCFFDKQIHNNVPIEGDPDESKAQTQIH
ncbi:hypothetical protein AN958_00733 [Leucoagaricus sp. SymC.cos]|nr:hypothetical protein AN958_00733 [Leucoagaricus sp. SymC.cos]